MLAYRRSNDDGYIEFECDVTESGDPILPEDATVQPPPAHKDGYSRSIRKGEWIYVEVPKPPEPTIEDLRPYKELELNNWKDKFLNQAFVYDGKIYIHDTRFREMLNSAVGAASEWGELPKFWITGEDEVITGITKEFLDGLGKAAYNEHQNNLMQVVLSTKEVKDASTVEELNAIQFPEPNTVESLKATLKK